MERLRIDRDPFEVDVSKAVLRRERPYQALLLVLAERDETLVGLEAIIEFRHRTYALIVAGAQDLRAVSRMVRFGTAGATMRACRHTT